MNYFIVFCTAFTFVFNGLVANMLIPILVCTNRPKYSFWIKALCLITLVIVSLCISFASMWVLGSVPALNIVTFISGVPAIILLLKKRYTFALILSKFVEISIFILSLLGIFAVS